MSYRSEILLCYSCPKSKRITYFIQNSLNAIVFNLQVILLIMEEVKFYSSKVKNQKVAITHLSMGIDTQVTHRIVGVGKVAE